MGVRRRDWTIFALSCLFLSLVSWANKYRLPSAGQVRGLAVAHQLFSDTLPACQTTYASHMTFLLASSSLQRLLVAYIKVDRGCREEMRGRSTSHSLVSSL